ncbi:MAG: class I SAM-dependent methyltransferase [Bacillota bacterium]|nr:class I SAM-dependent methyltransferase [Bacillota bacterium]
MTNKALRDLWDSRAEDRREGMKHQEFPRNNTLYEETCWRFIKPLLPPNTGRILEAGCGTGRWVYHLAPLGHRIVLSDFSPEMVRVASEEIRNRGVMENVDACHVLDICDMHALEDESFDIALALGGPVELCDNQRRAVEELRRVVKPGGYVICDVSNRYRIALDLARENNWTKAAETLYSAKSQYYTHKSFSPDEIQELFTLCGLDVLHIAAVSPFMSFPPNRDQLAALEDDTNYSTARDIFCDFSETPEMIGISSRLLIVGRR